MEKKKPGFSLKVNQEITNLFKNFGKLKRFAAGECVIRQGEYANHVYILLSGEAEVVRVDRFGNENRLAVLSGGDIVGEMGAFLENNQRSATVKAKSQTLIALECPNQMFIRGLFSTHELTYRVIKNYAERLNDLNILTSGHFQSRVMLVVGHHIEPLIDWNSKICDVVLNLKELFERSGLETWKITDAVYNFKTLRVFNKLVFPAEVNIVEVDPEGSGRDNLEKTVDVQQTEPGRVIIEVDTARFKEQMKRLSYC
ncbi:cyclic nucleotide-binding domain-containing protein [Seleniivibrio woodruffii]|uniref:cyclic nucleotide-binding domain-containing protein n=1 Tax=Seleniivibrio woodruffii TaxID=1078050 RepID=UPI0026F13497|nr:cyclic nucleotide-binding domain-containing protein [Seleniivibrio woodruffii]